MTYVDVTSFVIILSLSGTIVLILLCWIYRLAKEIIDLSCDLEHLKNEIALMESTYSRQIRQLRR